MAPENRILLLTNARTASHLLERMLSKQPNVAYGSHFLFPGREVRSKLLEHGPLDTTNIADREKSMECHEEGFAKLNEFLDEANRDGKTPFLHIQPHTMISPALNAQYVHGPEGSTHDPQFWLVGKQAGQSSPHTNPTVLPDEFLLHPGTKPLLTCRHPVLTVDGVYRGMIANFPPPVSRARMRFGSTLRPIRLMYDWYVEHGRAAGIEPIVIDADDYMGPDKESLMRQVCDRLGLDAAAVIYSWPRTDEDKLASMPKFEATVHQTLLGSDGVLPGYSASGKDLDAEVQSWTTKYGEEEAAFLRDLVDKAMPEYQYLYARRIVPK